MDDYYSLMGVEPDAPVDDIRAAYRDKKAAIVGATDADKVNAKKLNKAWNVLSDPYQRGRYDEERAQAVENGDLAESDAVDETPSTNGRRAAARPARERGQPRAPLKPTLDLPSGVHFAGRRQRIVAMVIDLVVLLVLFVGITQIGAQALAKNQKPQVVENVKAYNKEIDNLNKQLDDAKKAAKGDTTKCGANASQERQQVCTLDKQVKDKTKQRDDEVAKLNGIFFGSIALTFLLGFLYLVIPSMRNGQTLGKRFQHIKVVREDGSPMRSGDVVRRYGIIIIVTFGLFLFLRELAAVLVLIGVTRWLANANQQGLHDRFAKTIVIEDGDRA